jgi:hypothetical protein
LQETKLHYWGKGFKIQEASMFSNCPCLLFFLEIYFQASHEKTYLLGLSFAVLIRVLIFFPFGLQNKFPGKKHGMAKGKHGHFQYYEII